MVSDPVQRIEILIQQLEAVPDRAVRAQAQELVRAVVEYHGAGLRRILQQLAQSGDHGRGVLEALGQDNLVASLLLLHGLHPVDFDMRVRQALESLRPNLHRHGGEVELLGTSDGVVRLRVQASGPSSAQAVHAVLDEAIAARVPDVAALEVEVVTHSWAAAPSVFVPVEELTMRPSRPLTPHGA
jgi:Fe-S cluster biogenesis protein NfuA